MKLHLSSYRVPVPEALFSLLPMPATECTLALIPNAKDDDRGSQERAKSIDDLVFDLAGLGFKSDVVDLRDYEDPLILEQKLESYPVLWLAGGNTFSLRAEMKRSGLDQFLGKLLARDVVYCGESAGAIVAGITLDGAEVADDPGWAEEDIRDGLSFVPNIIVPHADNKDEVLYLNHMREKYGDDGRLLWLKDNQALIVDGDQQKIVSATG